MSIHDYTKEDLREFSFVDIALLILQEKTSPQSLVEITDEIIEKLDYDKDKAYDKIASFYTQLTIDGRFVILNDGKWDLRERHTHDVLKLDSNTFELDLDLYDENLIIDNEEEEEYDSIDPTIIKNDDDDAYDDKEDIKNLVVISEDDLQ